MSIAAKAAAAQPASAKSKILAALAQAGHTLQRGPWGEWRIVPMICRGFADA